MPPLIGLLLVVAAYLLGGIPWGVVLGRIAGGVDLRKVGSGATGTTNALRVLGWRISAAVFLLDFFKGMLPVVIGRWLGLDYWLIAAAGVAAVAGHCWSPFINFRGGKGMATGGGVAVGMFPWLVLLGLVTVLVTWLTRYVSLGSLATAAAGVAITLLAAWSGELPWQAVLAIAIIAGIIVWKHHGNIERLIHGTERRFGERVS
ncbi:MAG TPA: glycerol-3-phosphate 1-O-acyltransferase PlsY [Thermomicrobiales bacterium]|nr:glycerol-3-phosphate 1-O-acyltransferase PlsY [Thermomicrobiales bacterium]